MDTLSNLIRLSYWLRVKSVVPTSFHGLLPPTPEVAPIPGPPEAAQAAQEGSDAPDTAMDDRDATTKRAFEMLTMVRIITAAWHWCHPYAVCSAECFHRGSWLSADSHQACLQLFQLAEAVLL